VLANVASVALLAAARRHVVHTSSVQQVCCTSLLRLDAAEPIPADIIGPAWQMASNFTEAAVELNVQLSKSCVLFGAPSFTLDRRI
jgi:hypothetical protein